VNDLISDVGVSSAATRSVSSEGASIEVIPYYAVSVRTRQSAPVGNTPPTEIARE
jgi:hypothetical protein